MKKDKYVLFKEWLHTNGVIMPKLEFPGYFEDGLVGVKCSEDIQHREAIL